MNLSGKKVFVTGGTGFLGRHLLKQLIQQGADVVGLMHDPTPYNLCNEVGLDVRKVRWVNGDLRDFEGMCRIIAEERPTFVYHLGAQALHGIGLMIPHYTLETNIMGTVNLLEAVRLMRSGAITVVSTSDKAYGEADRLPYTEDMPMNGDAPYEVSKSAADLVARAYRKTYGMSVSVIRCGNIFGEGDVNYSRIIPYVITQALKDEPIKLRSNGELLRDYIYVPDVVSAFMAVAERAYSRIGGDDFNVGYENPISSLALSNKILDMMGKNNLPVNIEQDSTQYAREISEQWLNTAKIRKNVWRPIFSLDSGLENTIAWYTKYHRRYND